MQPVLVLGVNFTWKKHHGVNRKKGTLHEERQKEIAMNPIFLIILLSLGLFPSPASADSISCDGGIVSDGDSVVDLLMKCGQPAWKESHQEEFTDRLAPGLKQRTYVTVEQWTYNFGPQQLLRIVTIKNSVVTGVKTGQYGPSKDRESIKPECGDRIISTGDTKGEVLAKCGEPFYRNSYDEELREQFDEIHSRRVVVTVEEWTYNFGPQRFLRIITFRNGKVVDVRTGQYGR
jgi:hypothetical protein